MMQLFAIISKQDDGTTSHQRAFVHSFLSSQLNQDKVNEYLLIYEKQAGFHDEPGGQPEKKLTSMKDSVRSVVLCRKINKTLTQKQKVIVLIRLFELLKADGLYTEQRMGIINTAASVFKIADEELYLIDHFSRQADHCNLDHEELLIIGSQPSGEALPGGKIKHLYTEGLNGTIQVMRIKSADLYFLKYSGKNDISLNGRTIDPSSIYLLAPGSTLRLPLGTVYYSDVISRYLSDAGLDKLTFNAEGIRYTFPGGTVGFSEITIAEEYGLVGIMGASGSGKTTLLNVAAGIEAPDQGTVKINGIDIHREKEKAKGLIGYIAQDDLLIEELTVYQNLYYSAKLCFRELSDDQIAEKVDRLLKKLGLDERKDVKVGNPLNKRISGGQRKRLNIALELIREPSVLFVDEPTSGLSSRDSENVMDLLKELSRNGKLIFVVIHQPSSDIYKMFDRLIIMDTGGYPVYYGNPIEALVYFRRMTNQINSESGECSLCGNVNPESLFNIIEAKEIDDLGNYTSDRIKTPAEWNELFHREFETKPVPENDEVPAKQFRVPGWFSQMKVFITRDLLAKASNLQYLLISLTEAPLLAFILVLIIKYSTNSGDQYLFRGNENIPPYLFMSIIVAIFIGLTVSAEEIFRDRKILKREKFLNLSRSSYLASKILILFLVSSLQTLCFVLVGNSFLELRGMYFEYWIMLLATAFFANMLGLNISSAFNSAVTIYIVIPLLVIPQMVLGGAMFSFDKLNTAIGGGSVRAPVIADMMVGRWAYEAMAVHQFKNNAYERYFYEEDRLESLSSFKQAILIPELKSILRETRACMDKEDPAAAERAAENLNLISNELKQEDDLFGDLEFAFYGELNVSGFDSETQERAEDFLELLNEKYIDLFNVARNRREETLTMLMSHPGNRYQHLYDHYHNEFLADVVKKSTAPEPVRREGEQLVQVIDPVFRYPEPGNLSLRAHFFAPVKYLVGSIMETFYFNLLIIIFLSVVLYLTLYYDLLRKAMEVPGRFRRRDRKKRS